MTEQDKRIEQKPATKGEKIPPAGPHAKPSLIDKEKTPGAGTLPDESPDVNPGSG